MFDNLVSEIRGFTSVITALGVMLVTVRTFLNGRYLGQHERFLKQMEVTARVREDRLLTIIAAGETARKLLAQQTRAAGPNPQRRSSDRLKPPDAPPPPAPRKTLDAQVATNTANRRKLDRASPSSSSAKPRQPSGKSPKSPTKR